MLLHRYTQNFIEAGCDEVGRGCLCGPVIAAAVIIPDDFDASFINDSKKLNAKQREKLGVYIQQNALDYAIAEVAIEIIDQHNILNASIHAMHKALDSLLIKPEFILVDGNKFHPYSYTPHQCIVKGDGKFLSIEMCIRDRFESLWVYRKPPFYRRFFYYYIKFI